MEKINHKDRAHALLSASSAHRWLACPPSAVAAEAYDDTGSDYAAEGTVAHEVAEWVASGKSNSIQQYHHLWIYCCMEFSVTIIVTIL